MNFRKVNALDRERVLALFNQCLLDLIQREGIDEPGLFASEVQRLSVQMESSIENQGPEMYVAEKNGMLLGTIALLPVGRFSAFLPADKQPDFEIGCVYVATGCQRAGVGKFLFLSILKQAEKMGVARYSLDAGFSSSRRYWLNRLGTPTITLQNYWGDGEPHMIWVREVE